MVGAFTVFNYFKVNGYRPNNFIGICPPFTPLPIGACTAIFHPHCDSDSNCTSGLKCCPGPCNQQYCQST